MRPEFCKLAVKDSFLQGRGLFANEPIGKGKIIGCTLLGNAMVYSEKAYQASCGRASKDKGDELDSFIWKQSVRMAPDCFGTARVVTDFSYINHSITPNVVFFLGWYFAARDIKEGQELTVNYNLWLSNKDSDGKPITYFKDKVTGLEVIGCDDEYSFRTNVLLLKDALFDG